MLNKKKFLIIIYALAFNLGTGWAVEVTTVATGFNGSGDLAVGPEGNIFNANFGLNVANQTGDKILKITPSGEVIDFASGFRGAAGMDFDNNGNIIQANIGGNFISQVSPAGEASTIASEGFSSPVGVAVNSQNEIFVANCGNNTISKIENGVGVIFSSGTLFACPNGLAVDEEDNLYVVNFSSGVVVKVDQQGNASFLANSGGGNSHIVFGNNKLYFTSHENRQIFEMSLAGELKVLAGTGEAGHNDGDGMQATFTALNGIGISRDGKTLYVNEPVATGPANSINLNPNILRAIELDIASNDFKINSGLAGSWYQPTIDGQGVVFDFALDDTRFDTVMYWFTYSDIASDPGSELAGFGSTQSRWFTAIGPVGESSTVVMPIYRSSGGIFNDPAAVDTVEVGTVEVEFLSCFEAMMEFEFEEPEPKSGGFALQRLTPDVNCELLSQ